MADRAIAKVAVMWDRTLLMIFKHRVNQLNMMKAFEEDTNFTFNV